MSKVLRDSFDKQPPPHIGGLIGVGPPRDRLWKQGICWVCHTTIFGREPIEKNLCGLPSCQTKDDETAAKIVANPRYRPGSAARKNPCVYPRLRDQEVT
jgi:hypothetical protein